MACFLVPMTEAIVVSVVKKVVEKNERKLETAPQAKAGSAVKPASELDKPAISWSRRLGWLNQLLWGGVLLLAIEHVWHGEVVPWPPFLTAMNNPADIGPMLHEIATVGTSMAAFVTLVWVVIVIIADHKQKALSAPLTPVKADGNV